MDVMANMMLTYSLLIFSDMSLFAVCSYMYTNIQCRSFLSRGIKSLCRVL